MNILKSYPSKCNIKQILEKVGGRVWQGSNHPMFEMLPLQDTIVTPN